MTLNFSLPLQIANLNNAIAVLALKNFRPLLDVFDFDGRRAMACHVAENIVENATLVDTPERTEEVGGFEQDTMELWFSKLSRFQTKVY